MISAWYDETITVFPVTGKDEYGNDVIGPKIETKGRWEDVTDMIVNRDGEQIGTSSRVFLLSPVSVGDWIVRGATTATDPASAGARKVLAVRRIRSLSGDQELIVALL